VKCSEIFHFLWKFGRNCSTKSFFFRNKKIWEEAEPIILAIREAEIGKIRALGQPKQIVQETPISISNWMLPIFPSYMGRWDQENLRIGYVISRPGKKSSQDPISVGTNLCVVVHTCHPSDDRKWKISDRSPSCSGQKVRPYFQNNQRKRAGGMAQVVGFTKPRVQSLVLPKRKKKCLGRKSKN
jgi:hypothetical protein